MKQKILYVFLIATSISMFSMAGQNKETCSKAFCCTKLIRPKSTAIKTEAFDLSPLGFLYIDIE
jgi:hypothetical protein